MSSQTKEQKQAATRAILGSVKFPVRFSYVTVFEPKAMDDAPDGQKKYSVSILIDKSDADSLALAKKAIDAALEQGKSKWGGKIPVKLKLPLRDGDEERPEQEAYAGKMFINASSKTKPGIIDNMKQEITDETDFYSGCFGKVSVNFYPFDTKGSKGVACGLNNLQKLKDGDALGGKTSAQADFDVEEVEEGDDDITA